MLRNQDDLLRKLILTTEKSRDKLWHFTLYKFLDELNRHDCIKAIENDFIESFLKANLAHTKLYADWLAARGNYLKASE